MEESFNHQLKKKSFILRSEPGEVSAYNWYEVGSWPEQGDLLPDCPVLVLPSSLIDTLFEAKEGDALGSHLEVQIADLIVMSQSCDLANNKIDQVLLCAHYPASNQSKTDREDICKERRPALHMIEKCELEPYEFERQIIDFRTIYTLPKGFLRAFIDRLGPRVRLLPPYKEHLSQAFARYSMRVGLPRPLKED